MTKNTVSRNSTQAGGCLLIVLGVPIAIIGVIMSFTIIGAIIGVPMALVGGGISGVGIGRLFRSGLQSDHA